MKVCVMERSCLVFYSAIVVCMAISSVCQAAKPSPALHKFYAREKKKADDFNKEFAKKTRIINVRPQKKMVQNAPIMQREQPLTMVHVEAKTIAVARTFVDAWSISKELYEFIISILPEGSTILELGSGWGTGELAKRYRMFSVENDKKWLNKYKTTYIYAPIVNGWYDTNVLRRELPAKYDLILIDGPLAVIGRGKFFDNLSLFNTNVPMIFDDVNRAPELELMNKVAAYLGKSTHIFSGNGKQFGVILP